MEPRFTKELGHCMESIGAVLKKYDAIQRMDWSRINVDVENVVLVVVLHRDLEGTFEKWQAAVDKKNIIVLDKHAIKRFYGPTLFRLVEPALKVREILCVV